MKSVSTGNTICYCGFGFAAFPCSGIWSPAVCRERVRWGNGRRMIGRYKSENREQAVLARQDGLSMTFFKRHHSKRRHSARRFQEPSAIRERGLPEQTESESAYLKSLVDSHAKVTVVLNDGERFQGRIRYYDRDCFSIGLTAEGPRIFLRKSSISYISED
jgi:small nuclear ribonucleoprotein (snRNP)-like protein